jgi:hypothetical protein
LTLQKACDIDEDVDQIGDAVITIGGIVEANNDLLNQILTKVCESPAGDGLTVNVDCGGCDCDDGNGEIPGGPTPGEPLDNCLFVGEPEDQILFPGESYSFV